MGYLKSRELLTEEQRQELKQIPLDLSAREMAAYYSFSQHVIKIINRHRRSHNKLGFAVQLSVLRYPGWPLTEMAHSLIPYAFENGNSLYLIRTALDELRNNKIIIPAITTVERIVWEVRNKAETKIYKTVNDCL